MTWKESELIIKGFSKTIKNEAEKQKGRFLRILFGIFSANLLGCVLVNKGVIHAGEGVIRAGQNF